MVNKLRKRVILYTVASVVLVLALLMGIINAPGKHISRAGLQRRQTQPERRWSVHRRDLSYSSVLRVSSLGTAGSPRKQ